MIKITNMTVQPDLNSLTNREKRIYNEKVDSSKLYTYATWEELKFELKGRVAIMDAAVALEKSAVSFATFKKSRCNEELWNRKENGGFLLKADVLPSVAIRDIYENGEKYAFECATAIIIILYKAALEVLGDDIFNKKFRDLFLYSWNYDSDLRLITVYAKGESYPGDILYFKNPDVDPKMPEWQGENVVKLEGGIYYGHGIGELDGDQIIERLNKLRKPGGTVSAFLVDEVTRPDFSYWAKMANGSEHHDTAIPSSPPTSSASGAHTTPAAGAVVARIGGRTMVYAR